MGEGGSQALRALGLQLQPSGGVRLDLLPGYCPTAAPAQLHLGTMRGSKPVYCKKIRLGCCFDCSCALADLPLTPCHPCPANTRSWFSLPAASGPLSRRLSRSWCRLRWTSATSPTVRTAAGCQQVGGQGEGSGLLL